MPKTASATSEAPLVNENFCGNAGTMDSTALSGGGCMNKGTSASIIRLIFGIHHHRAQRGHPQARLRLCDALCRPFAADDKEAASAQLEKLRAHAAGRRKPTGVIAVWAPPSAGRLMCWRLIPASTPIGRRVWGHSRQGKAALLAAAFDTRIEAVIPLQAGKGGATLTRSYAGESVEQITKEYPHWFAPSYAASAGHEKDIPVDQHQLIALVAPRPVMLGNGWKDVWSDPNGAFRAAIGADPVYADGQARPPQIRLKDRGRLARSSSLSGPAATACVTDWNEMLNFSTGGWARTTGNAAVNAVAS
jgi:hypothetical protein